MSLFLSRSFSNCLALFLVVSMLLLQGSAHAAEQIGVKCEALGVSTMSEDQKNLIVCLKDDAGGLVWKSMTGAKAGGVPVGAIIAWPVVKNPPDMQNADGTLNWLDCNGQSVPQTVYPELYAIIGAKLPDLRGLFLRGLGSQGFAQNNGSTVGVTTTLHTSSALGQVQGDASRKLVGEAGNWVTRDSWHSSGAITLINQYGAWMESGYSFNRFGFRLDSSLVMPTAEENRPVNMSVRYLIRART